MSEKKKVSMGDRVKDAISGLTGIVTARSEFLYGCIRIGIQPEKVKDGKPVECVWIDEDQAVVVKAGVLRGYQTPAIAAPVARRAGPRPDATNRRDASR